jgi:hypothetical protein
MRNITTLFGLLLLLCCSCNNESKKPPYIVIDLEGSIGETTETAMLNDFFDITRITLLETSKDFLLSHIIFADTNVDELVINDRNAVYLVDKNSGRMLSKIGRIGNGPGEYTVISDVNIDNDGNVVIFDSGKKTRLSYTREGAFLTSLQKDSIGLVRQLDNGAYIVNYTPNVKSAYSIGIYDSDWNLLRQGVSNDTVTEYRMLYYDALNKYNGEYFFRQSPLGDTIYRLTPEMYEPYIIINKGHYKTPANIYSDLNILNRESSKYITQDFGRLADKYFFIRYYYDNKCYNDIWDITESKLLYRGIIGSDGGIYGIPLMINGQKIDVWPDFVNNDYIYIKIDAGNAVKFMPNISEDDNPVIVELKLKN